MSFKNNLKSQRLKSHFSQEVLAEKVSVSRQTISKWENGDTYPSTEHIFMLAEILDCSVNDLIHNPPSSFIISTTKTPEGSTPIQSRPNRPKFLIAELLAALILVASTFTLCFKTPNYSKINTQKLAIFDQVLNDSLNNLIDDPIFNNSTNKKIVGYGITEPDGTLRTTLPTG